MRIQLWSTKKHTATRSPSKSANLVTQRPCQGRSIPFQASTLAHSKSSISALVMTSQSHFGFDHRAHAERGRTDQVKQAETSKDFDDEHFDKEGRVGDVCEGSGATHDADTEVTKEPGDADGEAAKEKGKAWRDGRDGGCDKGKWESGLTGVVFAGVKGFGYGSEFCRVDDAKGLYRTWRRLVMLGITVRTTPQMATSSQR